LFLYYLNNGQSSNGEYGRRGVRGYKRETRMRFTDNHYQNKTNSKKAGDRTIP